MWSTIHAKQTNHWRTRLGPGALQSWLLTRRCSSKRCTARVERRPEGAASERLLSVKSKQYNKKKKKTDDATISYVDSMRRRGEEGGGVNSNPLYM